ncbi:DNA-directed RNA polymerase subunit H [Candidatus Bathyarchaeota archaeon]|nr:DNA-directed RNA polymerase subunit H [Candidatus Bathyarchaeota archaeon]
MVFTSKIISLEEKRADLIIKYRKFVIDKKELQDDRVIFRLTSGKQKIIMHVILGQKTIGISYVRELQEMVENEGADKGILVGDGKYTYSARSSADDKSGIELIPPTLPTFDIFEHELVPMHEKVTPSELKELIEKYHAEPYQFPWIKFNDPISIILGAKPGDVLKIIQNSETAGKSISYRYVV